MIRIPFLISVFSFLMVYSGYTQKQHISRIEPPNWWVGMSFNEIELLVYGEEIGMYSARLETYSGVKLKGTKTVLNKNYLFLTLEIADEAQSGTLNFTFSRDNQQPFSYSYPLLQRDEARKKLKGFDSSDAIYLITPDRFVNGNTRNDNVSGLMDKANRSDKGGRHGGDIEGIMKNLDYIKDLGFTAIWLNPVLENDMPKNSYHGYATTDFYKVDPRYGSNELFKEMCMDAAEKGIKVIMDMIANHCGLEHWWMKDLPSEDWINQWPEYTGTNHRKTVILDPYASKIDYRQFFDGWFVPSMPDLNQRNSSMAKYLIQNSIWWIEYSGISGIRMDTYPYPDMYFMSDWTKAIMTEYPDFNIVGEEWVTRPAIVSYWQEGKENPNGYNSYLKSLMDFPLQNALVNSLNNEKTWTSSWTYLYEELGQDYLYPDPLNLVIFPDNHDMSRIYTQLNEDVDLLKLALVHTATVRGIPQIYYGTEILMKNPGTEDHGIIRSDFPGGWEGDKVDAFTGNGLTDKQKDVQLFTKKLFNWRKNAKTIHKGNLMHFSPKNDNEIYVFFRYDDSNKIMIVLNKDEKDITIGLNQYEEILGQSFSGRDVLSETEFENSSELFVKAKNALIIELEE
ncbi:glycoside hydrolase family 13 protein [Poritiphilus flavus]|uniref:Alpha-amylase n=1 Tax=Poritiphilus flavus TaxID=2697053 RepID=A0A6L9EC29_9FLAO|nr:glycoside hydrolase family 13 protein [Poritiphilus flavus]NAS12304.1 alpha-amylase [Poritiphilus flavus]